MSIPRWETINPKSYGRARPTAKLMQPPPEDYWLFVTKGTFVAENGMEVDSTNYSYLMFLMLRFQNMMIMIDAKEEWKERKSKVDIPAAAWPGSLPWE